MSIESADGLDALLEESGYRVSAACDGEDLFDGLGYSGVVYEALKHALESEQRIGYAILFGSSVRRPDGRGRDADIALGLEAGASLDVRELGELASRLEAAAGRPVDLVLMNEAPPALAYRVFRDGKVLLERNRKALVDRKARAILEYLDFRPVEEACTRGVLAAARGR